MFMWCEVHRNNINERDVIRLIQSRCIWPINMHSYACASSYVSVRASDACPNFGLAQLKCDANGRGKSKRRATTQCEQPANARHQAAS